MPSAVLLFNPRAGQGRGERTLARIARELRRKFELEVTATTGPPHLRELVRRAVRESLDFVFVLGGDGTLRLAAGELAGSGTALAPLPGGTTNVVARAFGLPRDPVAAARALAGATVREIDVGRAGAEAFLMQLSGGLDARVMAAVDVRAKRRFGKLAIAVAALRVLGRDSLPEFTLEVDGVREQATGFVVANLAEYAGAFRIVPNARPDDGALDLLLFRGRSRRAALGFAFDLVRGRHPQRTDVSVRPVGRVTVLAPDRFALQADGDPFPAEPAFEIALAAHRLRLLAPAGPDRAPDR